MESVTRFWSHEAQNIRCVRETDFDRVTAERDALQLRLNTADEREDQLATADPEIVDQVESALRRSFKLGQVYWQQADSDSTCQQNKCDQTMETQAQHILNVLKSINAALNSRDEQLHSLEQRRYAEQQAREAAERRVEELNGLLRTSLIAMNRIYEAGRDFIVGTGSDCDSVELMMENDPTAREIRAALNPTAEAESHEA